jgi:hypothetical protein
LVAVVTPRDSDTPTRSAPEVIGVVEPAALRALVAADPNRSDDDVTAHAGPAPVAVGAGENLAAAKGRLAGDVPVLVLVDGRAVTVVARNALEQVPVASR